MHAHALGLTQFNIGAPDPSRSLPRRMSFFSGRVCLLLAIVLACSLGEPLWPPLLAVAGRTCWHAAHPSLPAARHRPPCSLFTLARLCRMHAASPLPPPPRSGPCLPRPCSLQPHHPLLLTLPPCPNTPSHPPPATCTQLQPKPMVWAMCFKQLVMARPMLSTQSKTLSPPGA